MRYMLLIHGDEKEDLGPGDPGFGEMMKGYGAVTAEMRARGELIYGDPLQPVATATSLRYEGPRLVLTDGPYAETREQLGGFYLVDCKTRDEAIAYATKIPGASRGAVEVRQMLGLDTRVVLESAGQGYLLLIYGDDSAPPPPTEGADPTDVMARHQALTARALEANAYLTGDALYPASTATAVRVRDGNTLLTDGPFAETREQLGGFYALRCRDLDHALDYARELADISARGGGCIEVRPVANFG